MTYNIKDLGKCGIYCIRNTVNNKVYIGKSVNIHKRMITHIAALNNKNTKQDNLYFINSWHKYGADSFKYSVLEYLELDEDLLKERELYWMSFFNSTDKKHGYNLRQDSSTTMITHSETRIRLSEARRNYILEHPEYREYIGKKFSEFWKNNPDKLDMMREKSRKNATKYYLDQYTKDCIFVKRWNSIKEILIENPTYKQHNIYAVASGEKPSIYGFIWKKVLKEDIVHP